MSTIQFARIEHFVPTMDYMKKIEMAKERAEIEAINAQYGMTIERLKTKIKLLDSACPIYPNHGTFRIGHFDLGEGAKSVTRILNDSIQRTLKDCIVYNESLEAQYDNGDWFQPSWDIVERNIDTLYKDYRNYLKENSYEAKLIFAGDTAEDETDAIRICKNTHMTPFSEVVGVVPSDDKGFYVVCKKPQTENFVSEGLLIALETIRYIKNDPFYYVCFS